MGFAYKCFNVQFGITNFKIWQEVSESFNQYVYEIIVVNEETQEVIYSEYMEDEWDVDFFIEENTELFLKWCIKDFKIDWKIK